MIVKELLRDSFGIGPEEAWAQEAFGRRLSELATGSFAPTRPPSNAAAPRRAAQALLARPDRPKLAATFAKPAEALTDEDRLLDYALVCYLVEVHGPKLVGLLDEIGRGSKAAEIVLNERLGLDMATIEARLRRWLGESGS